MIWIVLGLLGGLGSGPELLTHILSSVTDLFLTATSTAAAGSFTSLFHIFGLARNDLLSQCAGALAAVAAPGLTCMFFSEAIKSGHSARNAAALLLTCGAFASLVWIPAPQGLFLIGVAVVADLLLALTRGPVLMIVSAVAVSVVTGRILFTYSHSGTQLANSAHILTGVGGDVGLWKLALAVLAIAPAWASVLFLLRPRANDARRS